MEIFRFFPAPREKMNRFFDGGVVVVVVDVVVVVVVVAAYRNQRFLNDFPFQ